MEEVLKEVIAFADKAHGTQTRKYSSDRYIVHPVRVMEMCRRYTEDVAVLSAALLHDVLEDTAVDEDAMGKFLRSLMNEEDSRRTVSLVEELTDVYVKEKYPRLNRKKRKAKEADRIEQTSADSQTIKYADIIDNCAEIAVHDPDFAVVFLKECRSLLRRMKKGNKELYQKAVEAVDKALKEVEHNPKRNE